MSSKSNIRLFVVLYITLAVFLLAFLRPELIVWIIVGYFAFIYYVQTHPQGG